MAIQREHWISLEEYHEIERNSEVKYEYSNGRIYDMSGGSKKHNRIGFKIAVALELHLGEKECRTYTSDVKVLPLGGENPSYLPDVTVTCDPDDYQDEDSPIIRSPRLIIEVLSPSTYKRDRGEKLQAYQRCASLEEYVMINTRRQEVEVHYRKNAKEWDSRCYTAGDSVVLASVGLTIPVSTIYAGTNTPAISSVRHPTY